MNMQTYNVTSRETSVISVAELLDHRPRQASDAGEVWACALVPVQEGGRQVWA